MRIPVTFPPMMKMVHVVNIEIELPISLNQLKKQILDTFKRLHPHVTLTSWLPNHIRVLDKGNVEILNDLSLQLRIVELSPLSVIFNNLDNHESNWS